MRLQKAGTGAKPVVPLSEITGNKENIRPARGQRASIDAEEALAARVRLALEQLRELDDTGDASRLAELLETHI